MMRVPKGIDSLGGPLGLPSALCILLASIALPGCETGTAEAEGPVLPWDTLDVVQHVIPADSAKVMEESLRWTLSSEPLLEVGALTGDEGHAFAEVRDVMLLRTGHVAVADVQASEVRFFDPDGALLEVAGSGDGPGEVRMPVRLGECAPDSVFAYDLANGRTSVFSAEGAFVRSFTLDATGPGEVPGDPPTCSRDGHFVAQAWVWTDAEIPEGPFEALASVFVTDASGTTVSTVGDFPTDERVGTDGRHLARPLGRRSHFAIAGGQVYVGLPARHEIGVFTLDGAPRAAFGIDLPLRPITQTLAERYAERETREMGLEGEVQERMASFIRENVPEYFPSFDRLLVASDGRVWVRRYPVMGDETARWDIFSGGGEFAGFLEVPRDFEVQDVGEERIAGSWRGAFDEQYVRVYALHEPR